MNDYEAYQKFEHDLAWAERRGAAVGEDDDSDDDEDEEYD